MKSTDVAMTVSYMTANVPCPGGRFLIGLSSDWSIWNSIEFKITEIQLYLDG